MDIFAFIRSQILDAIGMLRADGIVPDGLNLSAITAEPPRDASHGDVATNAAMVLAKPAGKNPRELAEALAEKLRELPEIATAEIAGPGFINLTLADAIWPELLSEILKDGVGYGNADIGQQAPINVEYVSANPTGPLHMGHARGAVIGDVLARLLQKAGYNVTKEYYVNDAGGQIATLARSAHLRYREALGESIEIPEGLYPGDYLIPIGNALADQYGAEYKDASEEEWMPIFRPFVLDSMLEIIKDDLRTLGIEHDVFTSEKTLADAGAIDDGIAALEQQGLVYTGILEPPKGKTPEDWEPREQLLFKASEFGDDVDRPLKKSDGSHTYFAADIAYHHDKISRGFNEMVITLGADHGGYVKRLKAAVKALSNGEATIDVLINQLVNFLDGGQPLKMSKRAGRIVTVRDVAEAVGADVVRFIMLTRKADATLDFDLEKVTEQSKDNPVFYVQYAHARANSVFRQAGDAYSKLDLTSVDAATLSTLTHESEQALIRSLANWPRTVIAAARTREPHRIAFYLQELAASFHSLWNAGKDDDNLRFIIDGDEALTTARLCLVEATRLTIASGLQVMGIAPVESM